MLILILGNVLLMGDDVDDVPFSPAASFITGDTLRRKKSFSSDEPPPEIVQIGDYKDMSDGSGSTGK